MSLESRREISGSRREKQDFNERCLTPQCHLTFNNLGQKHTLRKFSKAECLVNDLQICGPLTDLRNSRGRQGFLQMSASLHYMRYYSSSLIQSILLLLPFSATFPSKCCFTETEVEQEVQEMHLTCFRMQQDPKLSLL